MIPRQSDDCWISVTSRLHAPKLAPPPGTSCFSARHAYTGPSPWGPVVQSVGAEIGRLRILGVERAFYGVHALIRPPPNGNREDSFCSSDGAKFRNSVRCLSPGFRFAHPAKQLTASLRRRVAVSLGRARATSIFQLDNRCHHLPARRARKSIGALVKIAPVREVRG